MADVLPVDPGPTPLLVGPVVRLEPFDESHVDGLGAAAEGSDGPEYTWIPAGAAAAAEYLRAAVEDTLAGRRRAFAVVRVSDDRVVGSTSFLAPLQWSDDLGRRVVSTVEVGSTWYSASVRGTAVNPATKLLLLQHAFEVWSARRVEFRVDSRNERSLRAVQRLGARHEGVLRSLQPGRGRDGSGVARDTAIFSVIADEWPAVRAGLVARVAQG